MGKVAFVLLVLLAVSCGVETTQDETTTTTSSTTMPPSDPPDPPDPVTEEPEEEGEATTTTEAGGGVVIELTEPAIFEENGLRLEIDALAFLSLEEAVAEADEFDRATIEAIVAEETETLVYLRGTLANNSDATVHWHPSQGTLQIGTEQQDANLFFTPDELGGNDILDGTEDEGFVVFEFRTPRDELVEVGSARFVVSEAFDDDFNQVAEKVDLTLEW